MKLVTLICLLSVIAFFASASGDWRYPWFSPEKKEFSLYDDHHYRLFVPCSGGSGNYHYRYSDLPYRWDYRGKYLYIPTKYYSYSRRYYVKTSVYDIYYKVYLKKTLVFSFTFDYKVSVYVRPYDYVYGYKKEVCVFPSDDKLEMLVKEGDVDELSDIIDHVKECDTKTCSEKSKFLKVLLNKLKMFIEFYNENIEDLEAKIVGYEAELAAFEAEQNELNAAKASLQSIYKLQRELKSLRNKLAFLEARIEDDQDQIASFEASIAVLEKKADAIRWNIKRHQSKVDFLEGQIKLLDEKIAKGHYDAPWLRKEKYALEDQVAWIQKKIKALQDDLDDVEDSIAWKQKKIEELKARIAADTAEAVSVRAQIADVRARIGEVSEENKRIMARLDELEDLIREKNNQIRRARWEIKVIELAKSKLEKSLKDFERIIDSYWYKCWKIAVEVQQKSYGVRYYATGPSYHSYVKAVYGKEPESPPASVAIADVSYGSAPWKSYYGVGKYSFKSAYACHDASPVSWTGRIARISKDVIYVLRSGVEHPLYVHSCSFLQSITGFSYPRVDDRVYFKGHIRTDPHSYDIHSLLCY